jgi:hypothetical protein
MLPTAERQILSLHDLRRGCCKRLAIPESNQSHPLPALLDAPTPYQRLIRSCEGCKRNVNSCAFENDVEPFVPPCEAYLALVRRNFRAQKTRGSIRPRSTSGRNPCVVLVMSPLPSGSCLH